MLQYQAPLEEYDFVAQRVLQLPERLPLLPEHRHITTGLVRATLEMGAELAQELLSITASETSPSSPHDNDGVVASPEFESAYRSFYENGWPTLAVSRSMGGLGFPRATTAFFNEMLASANLTFSSLAKAREEVLECIARFGDEQARDLFCDKLSRGEWLGNLCLQEPLAGCNLDRTNSVAIRQMDGSYLLTGTKIAAVDCRHDIADNIVHLVLARTVEAPAGTEDLSLFAVPKYNHSSMPNGVSAIVLGQKNEAWSSATCALEFKSSKAYLVGQLDRCLAYIKPKMCSVQLATGIQLLGLAEIAYQNAIRFSQDCYRISGLSWAVHAEPTTKPRPSPVGVKLCLTEQRLFIEPARLLCAWVSTLLDETCGHPNEERRKQAMHLVELLAPVIQGYLFNQANQHITTAVHLIGRCGSILKSGMAQLLRESAISAIYEDKIYVWDYLGHKAPGESSQLIGLLDLFPELVERLRYHSGMEGVASVLSAWTDELKSLPQSDYTGTELNRDIASLIAPDLQELLGVVVFGYLWAWIADAALSAPNEEYLSNKPALAKLYFSEAEIRVPALIEKLKCSDSRLDQLAQIHIS